LAEGWQRFHLHATGFEPRTFFLNFGQAQQKLNKRKNKKHMTKKTRENRSRRRRRRRRKENTKEREGAQRKGAEGSAPTDDVSTVYKYIHTYHTHIPQKEEGFAKFLTWRIEDWRSLERNPFEDSNLKQLCRSPNTKCFL
jgi:hypothetical protein